MKQLSEYIHVLCYKGNETPIPVSIFIEPKVTSDGDGTYVKLVEEEFFNDCIEDVDNLYYTDWDNAIKTWDFILPLVNDSVTFNLKEI